MPATLYQRVLGEGFELLPEPLRRFHGAHAGGSAQGTFRVERGAGALRNVLATLGGLPPAGERVPLRLDVACVGDEERWTRTFGEHRIVTRQVARAKRLVERHALWTLRIRLVATRAGMELEHERTSWSGIPLPQALAPRVTTRVEGRPDGWFVEVTIGLPVVGMVCRYAGEVRPA